MGNAGQANVENPSGEIRLQFQLNIKPDDDAEEEVTSGSNDGDASSVKGGDSDTALAINKQAISSDCELTDLKQNPNLIKLVSYQKSRSPP
jgi:hypothetical protein